MAKKQGYIDFDEYIRQGEPAQREAAYAWSTAIGLQAVDGLQVSDYLLELARKNIKGELTMDEVSDMLDKYHAKSTPTSTGQVPVQVPDKLRTSTGQVRDMYHFVNPDVMDLLLVIGEQKLSVKEMMTGLGLKGRDSFLKVRLNPAIAKGFVRLLFPEKPRHPRQKYLLTAKGLALYKAIN